MGLPNAQPRLSATGGLFAFEDGNNLQLAYREGEREGKDATLEGPGAFGATPACAEGTLRSRETLGLDADVGAFTCGLGDPPTVDKKVGGILFTASGSELL